MHPRLALLTLAHLALRLSRRPVPAGPPRWSALPVPPLEEPAPGPLEPCPPVRQGGVCPSACESGPVGVA